MAEFLIRGDDFDPSVISERLGIVATRSFAKDTEEKPVIYTFTQIPDTFVPVSDDEFRNAGNGVKYQPPQLPKPKHFSLWEIDTGYQESVDANIQLEQIYDRMKGKVEILRELKNQYGLNYSIEIVPQIEHNEKPALYLDQYIIDFAHKIGAIVDIDLYIYSS